MTGGSSPSTWRACSSARGQGGARRLRRCRVRGAAGRLGGGLRRGAAQRPGAPHGPHRHGAQPEDAAAVAGVVPPAPGDRRGGDRGAAGRGRDDAQRHHAGAAAARRRPAVHLRARVGGDRGRAAARPRRSRTADPRIAPRLRAPGADPASSRPDLFAIHPMYALEAEEEIVFLADAFLSHVPESGARPAGVPGLARPARTSRRRTTICTRCCSCSSGRSAGVVRRPAVGAEDAGPPGLPGRPAARGSRTSTWCTCTATRWPRSAPARA